MLALYKVKIPVRPCWDEGRKNVKSLVGGPNHCRLAVIRCLRPSSLHFSRNSNWVKWMFGFGRMNGNFICGELRKIMIIV